MESFLLRSVPKIGGQPGSELRLSRLAGQQWVEAAGPEPVSAWDCSGDTVDTTREFFLQTTSVHSGFSDIAKCLWTSVNLAAFDAIWGAAFRGTEPFRLYLQLEGELSALPWELLSRDFAHCSILRLARWEPAAEQRIWPLRLMIVVGASPTDPAVKANDEVASIRRAVREVNRSVFLKVVERPNASRLLDEMKLFCPHVIHFIGHGGPSVENENESCLKFDLGGGASWDWTRPLITDMLLAFEQETGCRLRMVFLNACRTLDTTNAASSKLPASLADQQMVQDLSHTFLQRACGVVAMQSDVDGAMAGILAEQIYKRLAAGDLLDLALRSARAHVKLQPGNFLDRREPYAACLTVTGPPEQVMVVPYPDSKRKVSIDRTKAFEVVSTFVGREDLRSDVFRCLEPPCGQAPLHTLYVVKGPEKTVTTPDAPGKTWFVNWCMEACVRHGYDVRWIPVAGERGGGLIDLMQAICDGDPTEKFSLVHRPLDPAAFRDFKRLLGTLLPAPAATLDIKSLNDEKFLEKICLAFRTALARTAKRAPLLLVLDVFAQGTAVFPTADFKVFLNQVLLSLADDNRRRVRAMLVLNNSQVRDYGLADLPTALYKSIDLEDLPPEVFPEIAWEYLERSNSRATTDKDLAFRLLEQKKKSINRWRISYLRDYAAYVEKVM